MKLSAAQKAEAIARYLAGESCAEVAAVYRCSSQTVYRIVREEGVCRNNQDAHLVFAARHPRSLRYCPTVEEIALAMARIREGWTEQERQARAGLNRESGKWGMLLVSTYARHNRVPMIRTMSRG